jgi:hypothetical protein
MPISSQEQTTEVGEHKESLTDRLEQREYNEIECWKSRPVGATRELGNL